MLDTRTRKLTLAGILVAVAVLGGLFSIPVLGSRWLTPTWGLVLR